MSGPKKVRIWSFDEASRTVPYVRPIFEELRTNFIAAWHFYRKNGYRAEGGLHDDLLHELGERGRELFAELEMVGVLPYYSPLRGIGLFPFLVFYNDGHDTKPREAYFVYKDSRDGIDSYIFNDDFCVHADLYGYEQPVPEAWKPAGAVPTLPQEVRP